MESILLWWIFCGGIGAAIGAMKGKWPVGLLLGALLGPIGVVICLFLSSNEEQSPDQDGSYPVYTPTVTGKSAASKIHSAFELLKKGVYDEVEFKNEKAAILYSLEFSPLESNKSLFLTPFVQLVEIGAISNLEMEKIKKYHSIQHSQA